MTGKLPSFTIPDTPSRRSSGHRDDLPVRDPKSFDGFPIVSLPRWIGRWSDLSACVVGGLELPAPYDEPRLRDLIDRCDAQVMEIAEDLAWRDHRKGAWDRWLDDPENFVDARYGEGIDRVTRVERAIMTIWRSIARRLGVIVGVGSQLCEDGRHELLARYAERHRQLIETADERVDDYSWLLRRPGVQIGDTLLVIVRLTLIANGATSKLAILPRGNLGRLIDEHARHEALRILKVNEWNRLEERS